MILRFLIPLITRYLPLLFISHLAYALPYPFSKTPVALLDMAIFQANLGWTDFATSHSTLDVINPTNSLVDVKFNSSGTHIALNLTDVKRAPQDWLIGGRIGAQMFSNLKDTVVTPGNLAENQINQTYSLQEIGGFFADFIVFKTIDRYYFSGFVGVGYDRYEFKGFQNFTSGQPIQIRDNLIWSTGARLGAGAGIQFRDNLMAGIEYTHRFDQSINALTESGNYPYESRVHSLHVSGNSVDLIFGAALYD